jgi:AraC family transcriptional regulator
MEREKDTLGSARDFLVPPGVGHSWENIAAARIVRDVEELAMPALSEHVVMVNVGRPYRMEERLGGRAYRTFGVKGDVAIIPAGTPAEFRSLEPGRQTVESFAMSLDPAFVRRIAEGAEVDPDGIELAGVLGGRDPEIEKIGLSLLSELRGGGPLGGVYADSLATLLVVRLLRGHYSLGRRSAGRMEGRPNTGLSGAALRRVTDYVEENLAQNLTLESIADVAHMSPFHFSRVFKLSTGLSPHQYVLRRRIEKAKGLLAGSDLPLHEVADLSGFTDQSHLARHFRRQLDTTPRSFRLASG